MHRLALSVILLALSAGPAGTAWPASGHEPDVPAIAAAHADRLEAVSSDHEAMVFFSSHLEAALGLAARRDTGDKTRAQGKPAQSPSPATETHDIGGRFATALAAWQLAHTIEQASRASDPKPLSGVLDRSQKQLSWLTGEARDPALEEAWRRATAAVLFPVTSSVAPHHRRYTEYADYLDRRIAQVSETDRSWVNIVDRDGPEGVRQALRSFWDEDPEHGDADEDERLAYATRYFHSRLQPILQAYANAAATRAVADAEHRARAYWSELQAAVEKARQRKGLIRLCGTWQWTMHNHQNHVDHKSIIVFPSPDSPNGSIRSPSQTVVLGDVVYLRWEFQGGVQEDSLLFTGEGRRLEGTFVNSSGAWGSITGKRTGACQP